MKFTFSMSSEDHKAIEKTIFFCSWGTIRPTPSLNLSLYTQKVIFTSTRFPYKTFLRFKMKNSSNISKPLAIIISHKTALELSRIIQKNLSRTSSKWKSNLIPKSEILSYILVYLMDISQIIEVSSQNDIPTKWVVLRNDLIMALKKINLISRENNYNTRMAFDSNSWIELSTWDTVPRRRVELPASIEWKFYSLIK